MDPVEGIGFDLDHTLAIDNRLERVALLRLLQRVLEDGGRSVGTFSDEIDEIDALLWQQRHGECSIDAAVDRLVAAHGVAPDPAYVDIFRMTAIAMVDAFVVGLPGVGATLAELRDRGIKVAVLTNGWSTLQQAKAKRAGFSGTVLVSDEIGERKPAPGAFGRLLDELGTTAARTLYVGDSPQSDVAGAHASGLGTVWFNWERIAYPEDVVPPQHTIASLDELLALVPRTVRAS
jgi:FMN phosphatase YigB (HAD superfamily)